MVRCYNLTLTNDDKNTTKLRVDVKVTPNTVSQSYFCHESFTAFTMKLLTINNHVAFVLNEVVRSNHIQQHRCNNKYSWGQFGSKEVSGRPGE